MTPAEGTALTLAGLVLLDLLLASRTVGRRAPRLGRDRAGSVRGPLAWLLSAGVRLYQVAWSARSAGACRFEPSCSAYALVAVRRHGGVLGGALAAYRLLRCQPLCTGGYDPVPAARITPAGPGVGQDGADVPAGPRPAPASPPAAGRTRAPGAPLMFVQFGRGPRA